MAASTALTTWPPRWPQPPPESPGMTPLPDLLARAGANPEQLHWQSWTALAPGPALIVLGAVHGNEVCGAHAIARTIADLHAGRLQLARGRLTLVPVANPLAFRQATRGGERNLNRHFVPRADPRDYEDRVTARLAPLLAAHEVLLDLHSFHTAGEPFAMVGPRDNPGPREPFARAAEELALARALGAPQVKNEAGILQGFLAQQLRCFIGAGVIHHIDTERIGWIVLAHQHVDGFFQARRFIPRRNDERHTRREIRAMRISIGLGVPTHEQKLDERHHHRDGPQSNQQQRNQCVDGHSQRMQRRSEKNGTTL